jgi:hypothetical protein
MFGNRELEVLFDFPDTLAMVNGWRVIKRSELTDVTPQRPHGMSYALILQDEAGNRLLGFDNSHAFDGAAPEDRYDHEHRPGQIGQRFRYDFVTASDLISDFFERLERYCAGRGVSSDFSMEGE